MPQNNRTVNEKKFKNWKPSLEGGRIYWYEVQGRMGWSAKYIKEVDENENTLTFRQEIYDDKGNLVEIHEKYPKNKGHQKI